MDWLKVEVGVDEVKVEGDSVEAKIALKITFKKDWIIFRPFQKFLEKKIR